jgi:hypothetical protein
MGAVSLAVVLAAQVAMAAEISDPQDLGAGALLDIASVHATRTGQVSDVSVSMYGTWHPIALSTSGKLPGEKYKNRIQIIFDTNNDGVPDYIGVILFQGHLKLIVRGKVPRSSRSR